MRRAGRGLRVGVCLSLTGRYARFGRQAAQALRVWQAMDGTAELAVEDDRSERRTLEALLPEVAQRCDVLLGPYSTHLMKAAGRLAADAGWVLWNHGGSGDDVETGHPGHVVSVLTPSSGYAEPYLRRLAGEGEPATLWVVHGKGGFGQRVVDGAERVARRLGIDTTRIGPGDRLPAVDRPARWDLLCAGQFEEDVDVVQRAQRLPHPPHTICAVAAGVREFGAAIGDPHGIFGVAQWFPGDSHQPQLGPAEADFLTAYAASAGATPDYPAVQAVAGAVLAAHCARQTGGTTRDALWSAATALDTRTLFGDFAIDPYTGAQVKHQAALLRWAGRTLATASPTTSMRR